MIGNGIDEKGSYLGLNEGPNSGDYKEGEESPTPYKGSATKAKGTVSLNNIDPMSDPNEAVTVLEYILTTISQSMGLNPKQAAGLLSNNNKYLVHVCVKGVKGDFEKISQWYQTVYSTSRHFAELIDREEEQGTVSLALKIVSCGLFSPNYEIVVWCLRVLSKLGSELDIRKLLNSAYDWFIEQDGGLSAIVYAINKHSDIIENVVSVMTQFGKYNMLELFNLHLKNMTPDQAQYMDLVTDIYSTVADTFIAKEALVSSGVLDMWIDTAIQQADGDNQSSVAEKTSALSFLAEVWLTKSERVQHREDIAQTILKLLNKGSRERSKNLKVVCFSILFRLLENFTSDKNNYAPKIYKSLTFLCVENHQDNEIREFMFKNFSDVFKTIQNIPVAILLESLLKQITLSGNVTYHFNIFDFEFFEVIAKHPRLHLKLAIDFIDLLGKIICNDVTYSSCASESFMVILRRYHDHENMQQYMVSFTKVAMKFLIDFEKQKKQLMKTHQLEDNKIKTGRGNSYIRQISNPEDQKMKWIQKTLVIHLLKNIIERVGSIHINNLLKPELIKTYLHILRKSKVKHNGLKILIELFGDFEKQIEEYKENTKNRSLEREDDVDLVSIKSHNVQNNLKNSVRNRKNSSGNDKNMINLSVKHETSKMSPYNKQKSMRNVLKKTGRDGDSELNFSVMSDFPLENRLKQNQEKLMYQPDSITLGKYKARSKLSKNEERALREIEKVKMRRQRRLEDKLFEEERKQMAQDKLKKAIQVELDKRKVEHGVAKLNQKGFKKKAIFRDTSAERDEPLRKQPNIELYDFSLEEEKDSIEIKNFLSTYKKLLHHLFKTYANTGFYHKNVNSFDALQNRLETMSLAEAIMMLKKNSIIPELLHKEEAATLLRLVNAYIIGDRREGKTLTFEAFNSYFLQIAMFVFGREPINLSHKPPVESCKALLKLFEKSALDRGESIKLYENPDHTILADGDILKGLNKMLKKNPDHPMPDGFKKVKIKEFIPVYKVPDYIPIPEKNKIALEIVDEILSKNFGFHLFEPISKPVITYKAKPILKQLMKHPMAKKDVPFVLKNSALPPKGARKATNLEPIPTRAYKGDRSVDRNKSKTKGNNSLSKSRRNVNRSVPAYRYGSDAEASEVPSQRQRIYNDVTPQLGLNLRLEVVKYPMHQRDHVQEVAETLEEIIEAASKGLTTLPPRKKYGLRQYQNKAQQMKQQKEEEKNKLLEKKNKQYENHRQALHERLQKMKQEKEQMSQVEKEKNKDKRKKQQEKKMKIKEEEKKEREKLIHEMEAKKQKENAEKKKVI